MSSYLRHGTPQRIETFAQKAAFEPDRTEKQDQPEGRLAEMPTVSRKVKRGILSLPPSVQRQWAKECEDAVAILPGSWRPLSV
jgi:hypothetical protein